MTHTKQPPRQTITIDKALFYHLLKTNLREAAEDSCSRTFIDYLTARATQIMLTAHGDTKLRDAARHAVEILNVPDKWLHSHHRGIDTGTGLDATGKELDALPF